MGRKDGVYHNALCAGGSWCSSISSGVLRHYYWIPEADTTSRWQKDQH
jgi:hypothetical protein